MTEQITVPRETWDAMREAHRKLIRAYVNLLESGRDRIVSLGGTCDPVDQMEASDPALREAKEALTAANAVSHPKPETAPATEGGAITSESEANAVSAQARCQYCDGTGDVHTPTGEWRGSCDCDAAHPQAIEPAGYMLVPVEPTREMLVALVCTGLRNTFYEEGRSRFMEEMAQGYGAMLAAAPEAKQ